MFVRLRLGGRDVVANPITVCDIEIFTEFGGFVGANTGGGSSLGGGGGGGTTLSNTEVYPASGDTAVTGGWIGLEVDCSSKVWFQDITRVGWVQEGDSLLHEVVTLPAECGGIPRLTSCNIKGFTIDNNASHM